MTKAWALVAVFFLSAISGCASVSAPRSTLPPAADTSIDAVDTAAARYREALQTICVTGVTAEIRQRYEETRRAAEAARYGGGRQANFWGPRHPEAAYHDCFQSPGFL